MRNKNVLKIWEIGTRSRGSSSWLTDEAKKYDVGLARVTRRQLHSLNANPGAPRTNHVSRFATKWACQGLRRPFSSSLSPFQLNSAKSGNWVTNVGSFQTNITRPTVSFWIRVDRFSLWNYEYVCSWRSELSSTMQLQYALSRPGTRSRLRQ